VILYSANIIIIITSSYTAELLRQVKRRGRRRPSPSNIHLTWSKHEKSLVSRSESRLRRERIYRRNTRRIALVSRNENRLRRDTSCYIRRARGGMTKCGVLFSGTIFIFFLAMQRLPENVISNMWFIAESDTRDTVVTARGTYEYYNRPLEKKICIHTNIGIVMPNLCELKKKSDSTRWINNFLTLNVYFFRLPKDTM